MSTSAWRKEKFDNFHFLAFGKLLLLLCHLLILYGVVYWKKVDVSRPILVLVLMLYMLVIHFFMLVLVLIVMVLLLKPVVNVVNLGVSVPVIFFVLVSMCETG